MVLHPALHRNFNQTLLEPQIRGHKEMGNERTHHQDDSEAQAGMADRSLLPVDLLVLQEEPPGLGEDLVCIPLSNHRNHRPNLLRSVSSMTFLPVGTVRTPTTRWSRTSSYCKVGLRQLVRWASNMG